MQIYIPEDEMTASDAVRALRDRSSELVQKGDEASMQGYDEKQEEFHNRAGNLNKLAKKIEDKMED